MNNMFGNVTLIFSVPVHNQDETLALMEANHSLSLDHLVSYEFYVMNSKGERIKVDVHDIESINFTELVEM